MGWYSIDPETREVLEIVEPRTIFALKRIINTAVGRWILAGTNLPDSSATDGVSEFESALDFPTE